MPKLEAALLICFLLYTVKISALEVTSQWQASYPFNPRAVQIEDRIVIFSLVNKSLIVNRYSIDGKNESKICEIPAAPYSELYFSSPEGSLTALGNGKIVLVAYAFSDKKEQVYVTFKPLDCSSIKVFKIKDYKPSKCASSAPNSYNDKDFCSGPDDFSLIPYHNDFDLFYTYWTKEQIDNATVMPLRYDDQGKRLETNVSFFLQNRDFVYPIYLAYLQTVKPFDSSDGYFGHFFSQGIEKAALLHFNSQFKLVTEMNFKPNIYSPIISNGLMTLCNSEVSNQTCEIVDLRLNVKHRVILKPGSNSFEPNKEKFSIVKVVNWPEGGFVIVYSIDNSGLLDVYLKDVNLDGSTTVTKLATGIRSWVDEIFTFGQKTLCVILKVWEQKENPYKSTTYCLKKNSQM